MQDRAFIRSLFIAAIFCLTVSAESVSQKNKRPNIVVIFCDDLGYGDLGVYGHPTIRTPHLDKMAGEGMRFTNFYSGSPACTASRYALLTGRYPVMSGFPWVLNPASERGIHPKELTMAEALKQQGYATAIFGKWHLGSTKKEFLPLQNGFDEYTGLPYSNDMIPPKWGEIALMQGNDTLELKPDQTTLTARYTQKAVAFIQKHKKNPFFIYVPFAMPHVPLHPGKDFAGKSLRGKYGDVVEEIDWGVGEILKALRKEGLAENTLVWFTSDNGPWVIKNEEGGSAGLFRDGKGSTWEGGMREPCIAWWPGTIKPQTVCDSLASTLDIYATNLRLAGASLPTDRLLDGRNITRYLLGQGEPVAQQPFFYYGPGNILHAVRIGPWKLHIKTSSQLGLDYFNGKLPLLFNLYTDPSEKYEVSGQHPALVNTLLKEIEKQELRIKTHPGFYDQ